MLLLLLLQPNVMNTQVTGAEDERDLRNILLFTVQIRWLSGKLHDKHFEINYMKIDCLLLWDLMKI